MPSSTITQPFESPVIFSHSTCIRTQAFFRFSCLEKIYICHIVEKQPMIDRDWAEAFAREWVDAWNAHDMERILSHYTDDFEMTSPLIFERKLSPNGLLKGKDAIRSYWGKGHAATPNMR